MTVAGYLKARYKSDALVVITSLGLIVMCIGTFLFLFFVLRAGGGLAAVMSTADSLLILTVAAIVDRKSTRLNSSHRSQSRMPSSA